MQTMGPHKTFWPNHGSVSVAANMVSTSECILNRHEGVEQQRCPKVALTARLATQLHAAVACVLMLAAPEAVM